jgi:hypothetical protein
MTAEWCNFRDKYGFGDGDEQEIDYIARKLITRKLNRTAAFKKARIKAVEYDRAGLHNHCMILIIPKGKTLKSWLGSMDEEEREPKGINYDEITRMAYEDAMKKLSGKYQG